jgi:inosose dehydratase
MLEASRGQGVRLSRRELLAGAVGTVALRRTEFSWQAAVRRYGGLPMGVHGASFGAFPVERAVAMVTELGLNRLEVSTAQIRLVEIKDGANDRPPATPDEIRALRRRLDAAQIVPTGYTTIRLTADHEANRDLFQRLSILGARNLTCIPEPETLDSLESLADAFGIRVAIHNNATGAFAAIDDVWAAVNGRGSNVGACLDVGNAIRAGQNPVEAVRRLGSRLVGIHLKDVASRDPNSEIIVLGKGLLDVQAFLAAVRDVGFPSDGALSLEYPDNPEDPLPGMRESLQIADAALRR